MRLPGQLPLEQAQAQAGAQALVAELAQVAELARLRVLVQVLRLEQALVQAQRLVQALARELGLVQAQAQAQELARVAVPESPQSREPPVVWVLEPLQILEQIRQQELAAAPEPRQVRELRVSRQQELQQHHLPAAAQELPPYRPVLPMKAPC